MLIILIMIFIVILLIGLVIAKVNDWYWDDLECWLVTIGCIFTIGFTILFLGLVCVDGAREKTIENKILLYQEDNQRIELLLEDCDSDKFSELQLEIANNNNCIDKLKEEMVELENRKHVLYFK